MRYAANKIVLVNQLLFKNTDTATRALKQL